MNTEKKRNSKIQKLITIIKEKYPDLQHSICKAPVLMPSPKCPDINIRNLTEYHDALDLLVKNHLFQPHDLSVAPTPGYSEIQLIIDRKLHHSFPVSPWTNSSVERNPGISYA